MRSIRFPARYYQAPNALNFLGQFVSEFGRKGFVLVDPSIAEILRDAIGNAFHQKQIALHFEIHNGQCTDQEIKRVTEAYHGASSDVVIGIGGGKALDTAKMIAYKTGSPLIIASSDAPCSALSVVYNEQGVVDRDVFLPRSPELILVDSALIAKAPARFLSAGIGDALATWYEADSCAQSGAKNCLGTQGAYLAYDVAGNCLDTIRTYGEEAVKSCEKAELSEALERVIEANILMSCIGSESGGVAAAHAIHHGLCELEDVHGSLHGEKVAIGVLASLLMKGDESAYKNVKAFCKSVNLPVTLGEIGIKNVTSAKLDIVAKRACRAGEIIHNEPFDVTETMVVGALSKLGAN